MNENIPTPPPQPVATPVPVGFLKKNNLVVILLAVLLVVSISVSIFLALQVQNLTKQLAQSQAQVQTTPTPTPDPTASWKTYTSEKYNYSIKYPQSWEKAENPNEAPTVLNFLQLKGQDNTELGLNFDAVLLDKTVESMCGPYACYPAVQIAAPFTDNSKIKLTLESWLQKYIESKNPNEKFDPNTDFQKITVDNYPTIKFKDSVFISKDDYIYFISFEVTNMPYGKPAYDMTIFDQILSTFKFTQ